MNSYFIMMPNVNTAMVEADYATVELGVLHFWSKSTGLVAAFSEWSYFKEESRVSV